MATPKAILFDLDDTLIAAYGNPEAAWKAVVAEYSDELHPHRDELVAAILATAADYRADPQRSRMARLDVGTARREVVSAAFTRLGLPRRAILNHDLVDRLTARFSQYRDEHMRLFDGAHAVLDRARRDGLRLGLVTNGAAHAQRDKLSRFDLGRHFDHVQIEGEAGYGKPDPRAFTTTLSKLDVRPQDAWMVGDNYEADIAASARLGVLAHWFNPARIPVPPGETPPARVIGNLAELFD